MGLTTFKSTTLDEGSHDTPMPHPLQSASAVYMYLRDRDRTCTSGAWRAKPHARVRATD